MSFINFSDLKRRVSIETVLEDRGLLSSLRKRGNDLVGPCPVHHGDNRRAFVVSLEKNLWYCFTRCMGGGDVIHLVTRLDDIDPYEASRYLQTLNRNRMALKAGPKNRLKSYQKEIKRSFKPFTARLPLHHDISFLTSKGIKPTTATSFEAGFYPYRGMLCGCVAIRLHDIHGRSLGYAGRRLDPITTHRLGKWIFPPALPKKEILYNYHRIPAKLSGTLVVTECAWGVMRLAQLAIPAVALLGSKLSTRQLSLLQQCSKVVLMLDGDRAGRDATETIKCQLRPHVCVSSVDLPPNKDPDDLDDENLIHLLNKCIG